jgi:GNAT superfamily N-acetyltransferase
MMIEYLTDRSLLADYFRQDITFHAYSMGDLDDLFWPDTTYLGLRTPTGYDQVSAIYQGMEMPVLLSFCQPERVDQSYFDQITEKMPHQFYAHLSPGLESYFTKEFRGTDLGQHYKMDFCHPADLGIAENKNVYPLSEDDLPELENFYKTSYPGNAFDPRTLETGMYFGCRDNKKLVSAGGVHVYSERYKVAALGNITTLPAYRNLGFARQITTEICRKLIPKMEYIGLNVKCDNYPAIHLYQSLGFSISGKYGEFSLKKHP